VTAVGRCNGTAARRGPCSVDATAGDVVAGQGQARRGPSRKARGKASTACSSVQVHSQPTDKRHQHTGACVQPELGSMLARCRAARRMPTNTGRGTRLTRRAVTVDGSSCTAAASGAAAMRLEVRAAAAWSCLPDAPGRAANPECAFVPACFQGCRGESSDLVAERR
jgi:hypothetical protein